MEQIDSKNKIVQSFWKGKELSNLEKLSLLSFLKQGHEYHLYVYENVKGIPDGIIIKDANEIIPGKYFFLGERCDQSLGGITSFADLFRYVLLYKQGGWWVDMDIICLRPFVFKDDYLFASELLPNQTQSPINCVMKVPKECAEFRYCLETCDKKDIETTKFSELGPCLLKQMIAKYIKQQTIKNWQVFCPIPFSKMYTLFYPNYDFTITDKMYSIHFWNDCIYYNGYDKNAVYNKDSIFEQLKKHYSI